MGLWAGFRQMGKWKRSPNVPIIDYLVLIDVVPLMCQTHRKGKTELASAASVSTVQISLAVDVKVTSLKCCTDQHPALMWEHPCEIFLINRLSHIISILFIWNHPVLAFCAITGTSPSASSIHVGVWAKEPLAAATVEPKVCGDGG